LDSAEAFLREHSFRDLQIEEVMDGTGLSRSSFYVHFRDRHDLAIRLMEEIATQAYARVDDWMEGKGEPLAALRRAMEGSAAVYVQHGRVLRAIADAATEDERVEHAYRTVIEGFVEAAAVQIAREVDRGRSPVSDPQRVAAALVWMNERYLTETLGREPMDEPAQVVDTLTTIWTRVVYGGLKPPASG
jgi:AcrR family transcriptional regulator